MSWFTLLLAAVLVFLPGVAPAAEINVGDEFIHPSQYSRPQVGDNVVSPAVPSEFKTRVTGSRLTVAPNSGVTVSGAEPETPATTTATPRPATTALHAAAEQGNESSLLTLLNGGTDPNAVDRHGATALMYAAARGRANIVERLLEHRADVNLRTPLGRTALMYAAVSGHVGVIELLLEGGADPDMADRSGKTAAAYARARGHNEILALLTTPPAPAKDPAPPPGH